MSPRSRSVFLPVVVFAALASCGDSPVDNRPIEILYFVQGPTGTRFSIVGPEENDDCMAESLDQPAGLVPSAGFGFQSADATHVLPGVFVAPHFFVLENERQPTRAVFRNLGSAPLTVLQLRGLAPPGTTVELRRIPPGECRSVSTFDDAREIAGDFIPTEPDDEFRFEVCSFTAGTQLPDGFECQDLAPRGSVERDDEGNLLFDAGISFLATLGDLTASFLTQCLGPEGTERVGCRTPSTFYLNAPRDQISAAMTQLPNQPSSFMQLDLYRGDRLLDSNRGGNDVFVRKDI